VIETFKSDKVTMDKCTLPLQIPLVPEAFHSMEIPNAGGSSDISEALSMQYMHDRLGATGFLAEMEVPYWIEYKICDYLMILNDEWVGVSVTRAVNYPFDQEYTMEKARTLLERKLYGLIVAKEAVMEDYGFDKCILHVWCYTERAAELIRTVYDEISIEDAAKGDPTYDQVYVMCTVCSSQFIYTNHPKEGDVIFLSDVRGAGLRDLEDLPRHSTIARDMGTLKGT
jgi:hypothetical protein